MPRLRIKATDGRCERLQIPEDCSLQVLKAEVARAVLQQDDPDLVKLSLNKQVELDGQATDTLRSLGICSGDTLWIMASTSAAQQPDTTPLTAKLANFPSTDTQSSPANSVQAPSLPGGLDSSVQGAAAEPNIDVAMQEAQQADEETDQVNAPTYLQRVLDHNQADVTSAHQLLLLALHAVLLETGLLPHQQAQNQYSLPASTHSSAAKLEYSLQQQPEGPACEVKYISLGNAFACMAATAGNGVATLNVCLKQHVDLQLLQPAPGKAQGKLAAFKQLPDLWTLLKDDLALRLVALLRQKVGLAPLSGLLTLPSDLKIKVLASLQAKDLAVLGCSCTELRHTAGNDALWQVLFKQEFGYAPQLDSTQGGSLRWQRLFARTWLDREDMRVKRRHLEMRHARQGRVPYGMPHIPPGPPGLITGGDYDRLPQPFLSGTPGMFGGLFGGGAQFGGQGPRGPPGSMFLGGSRSNGRAARAAGSFRLN